MEFTEQQIERMTTRLGKQLGAFLRERSVEQHYSVETLAELLEISARQVWQFIEDWETSGGREGIGPVEKLSHKLVRVPASAVNNFLEGKRVALGSKPQAEPARG